MSINRVGSSSASIPASIVDAKGDLIAGTANDTVARLAVGTTGHVLKSNSGTSTGLEWAAVSTTSSDPTVYVRDYATAGAADSTTGVNAAFTAAAAITVASVPDAYDGAIGFSRKARVVFARGLWNVTSTITIPQGVEVKLEGDAIVRAASAGTMGPIFDTAVSVIHQSGRMICDGVIDCNDKASSGIYLRTFTAYEIVHPRVLRPTNHGIILGDPASSVRSYEATVIDAQIVRPNGTAVPAGSIGIYLQYCTDAVIGGSSTVVVGFDYGVRNASAGGNNSFTNIHVWGYPPNSANGNSLAFLPVVGFLDDARGSTYTACYVDTPDTYGWQFTADDPHALLTGCRCYLNSSVLDNTVDAVRVDASTLGSVSTVGMIIQGETSHRARADYSGNLTGSIRIGTQNKLVASPVGDYSGDTAERYPDLHDRFLGADGAVAAVARWTTTTGSGSGASVVLNTNRLRMITGATGGYSVNDRVSVTSTVPNVADVDVLTLVEWGNPAVESYLYIAARATAAQVMTGSGYAIQGSANGGFIGLYKYVSTVQTGLYFKSGLALTSGSKWWLRLRVQGSTISLWHWPYAQTTPYQPTFSVTDTSVTAAGLVAVTHSGGSAAASSTAYLRQATVFALQ